MESSHDGRWQSSGIKPIETLYRGFRFRSRLEARWAIFFDMAKIPWRYEEEGFDLSAVELTNEPKKMAANSPTWYLPDFYLPQQECWIEVKGREPSDRDRKLMERLVLGTGKNGYIFWGIRPPIEVQRSHLAQDCYDNSALGFRVIEDPVNIYQDLPAREAYLTAKIIGIQDPLDPNPGPVVSKNYDHQWCECPRCGLVGIIGYGDARHLKCGCCRNESEPRYTDDSPRLMAAYMAARQARFEHQEGSHVHMFTF